MRRVSIDPVTRLEGHAKIDLFLDERGDVRDAFVQVPELRGFEQFCSGRAAEDMPNLTSRVCGVCPEAHHIASAKALDALFHVEPPPLAKKLRELLYCIFVATDHTTHFYALGGPDFIVGPEAPPGQRNLFGVLRALGADAGRRVLKMRRDGHHLIKMMGGRSIHANWALPGGVSRGIDEEQREEIERLGRDAIEFAKFSIRVFDEVVLKNTDYVSLIRNDAFVHRTYNMGTVDADNAVNFYEGEIRVIGPDGTEHARFRPRDYLDYIAEHVEPWSYVKFPYLKQVGWKGFVDGPHSGVYKATPLARLNVAERMATPLAQTEYERMFAILGGKPVNHTLATHWARIIELLYAAERWVELATDPAITGETVRALPTEIPDEGVGALEAPRGTLIHHYRTDERGLITGVNLIVGTTHNAAPIHMSVKKAAQALIRGGKIVTDGLLNQVEMAFRAYDPCMACATHSLPGEMPLVVTIRGAQGAIVQRLVKGGPSVDHPAAKLGGL